MKLLHVALLCFVAVSTVSAAPTTLVVCPREFLAALEPWRQFRRDQGHEMEFIDPPRDAADLQSVIRHHATAGRTQFLVLIGDAPADAAPASDRRSNTVPTHFVPAKVNRLWGPEATIATDQPFADIDGDGAPDLAVGRIPADSPAELSSVVRKILRYERQIVSRPWDRRITAVAGAGGFGPVVDTLIESAGQHILTHALPPGYDVALTRAKPVTTVPMFASAFAPAAFATTEKNRSPVREQMHAGCLTWVYLGHGQRQKLDDVPGPHGPESLLSVSDVPHLRCEGRCPLALLMTCYAGAFDADPDSLAEELLMAEEGPVAVIAATRVSMPYGNTVFGYEFLRASLTDHPATLGAAFVLAQKRAASPRSDDAMRTSLDNVAKSISPMLHRGTAVAAEDLVTERQEHVAMYHLLGDPLLRWRRPGPIKLTTVPEVVAGSTLTVEGGAEFDGDCLLELVRLDATPAAPNGEANSIVLATLTEHVQSGSFRLALPIPKDASGRFVVRAYLCGERDSVVGGANIVVRREEEHE